MKNETYLKTWIYDSFDELLYLWSWFLWKKIILVFFVWSETIIKKIDSRKIQKMIECLILCQKKKNHLSITEPQYSWTTIAQCTVSIYAQTLNVHSNKVELNSHMKTHINTYICCNTIFEYIFSKISTHVLPLPSLAPFTFVRMRLITVIMTKVKINYKRNDRENLRILLNYNLCSKTHCRHEIENIANVYSNQRDSKNDYAQKSNINKSYSMKIYIYMLIIWTSIDWINFYETKLINKIYERREQKKKKWIKIRERKIYFTWHNNKKEFFYSFYFGDNTEE